MEASEEISEINKLKEISNSTFKMGNDMRDRYLNGGGITHINSSVRAYNVTIKAIKYQLIYSNNK